jgi:hypothetical protein
MANFASLRGPVGMNRVYVLAQPASMAAEGTDPAARRRRWLAGLRAGRTLATNGPLLGLSVEGQAPGAEVAVAAGASRLQYKGFLRSVVPVDHLELVMNGKVVRTIHLTGTHMSADFEGRLPVAGNGWLLVRAWNDAASPEIFDLYPYATTNAFFFRAPGTAVHCGSDAQYFLNWIDRLDTMATAHEGYNSAQEREATLNEIHAARAIMSARQ